MTNRTLSLTESIYTYLCKNSLRESTILQELRQETAKLSTHIMQIAPEQGQFMALLLEMIGAKRVLEIGTYTGYSALVMAQALPQDGTVLTCDINEEWTQIAQSYWQKAGMHHKIKLQLGPALDTMENLLQTGKQGTFDFIFIDADKANYLYYYDKAVSLVRVGGLITIDNVLWHGKVSDPQVQDKATTTIRSLTELIHHDQRMSISLVPIGDGLMLARKR